MHREPNRGDMIYATIGFSTRKGSTVRTTALGIQPSSVQYRHDLGWPGIEVAQMQRFEVNLDEYMP